MNKGFLLSATTPETQFTQILKTTYGRGCPTACKGGETPPLQGARQPCLYREWKEITKVKILTISNGGLGSLSEFVTAISPYEL